jgi:hypothetical protein
MDQSNVLKYPSRPKYSIEAPDFMDHQDEGPWRSYDLQSEGDTLEELLTNAVYWQTDQDGGSLGEVEADDDAAQAYITNWYNERVNGK